MFEDKSVREMYKKLKVNGSLIKQFLIGLRPKLYLSVRYQSKSLAQHEQKRFISRWALCLGDSRFRFDKFFKPQICILRNFRLTFTQIIQGNSPELFINNDNLAENLGMFSRNFS